jgi:pyruvate kinase
VLTRGGIGKPARRTETGEVIEPARIACSNPEVIGALHPGERVKFDDGKIEGIVRAIESDGAVIEITLAADRGSKLRSEKGINVPDTDVPIPGLTEEDCSNLDYVVANADMVALSFVNSPKDVARLQAELAARGGSATGVLIKIETAAGFEQLPLILLRLMRSYPAGIMIARGDLAVELGWERMAEVQEEVLWLCEAAHLPTVWATQVLEQLAQTGLPSRAEITDAAMAQRAECVMLNKGPHILDAISTLSDILGRMQGHQAKKMALLRSLRVTHGLAAREDESPSKASGESGR